MNGSLLQRAIGGWNKRHIQQCVTYIQDPVRETSKVYHKNVEKERRMIASLVQKRLLLLYIICVL